jgi:hypothetical protein
MGNNLLEQTLAAPVQAYPAKVNAEQAVQQI